jgi:starch-binding outer membrane protein, SusD/RagB family
MKIASRHPLVFGVALATLVSAGLYGCKDFLENASEPQGTLDANTLTNKAGVEGSLIATYRILDCTSSFQPDWGCAASNWVWGSVTSDDAYKGSEASDQPNINDIEAYHWATGDAETYLNTKWRGAFEGVVRANATLRLLKQVRTEKPGEIGDADAKGIEGEATFLRAHYEFEAWRLWGNIPYYREDDTDFRKPNLQSTAVVTEILKDLDAAIGLLPTSPRNAQIGRADQWTAKAYKGRVQMYAGQFAAALTTLREVRTSGPYALEASFDRVWTGFQDFSNGKETIFAYQASANDGETNGNNANYGERLNFPHSGSPFGCCGFHQPSQNLVNYFAVDANGLPIALSNPNWNSNNANFVAGNTQAVDPRLDWTVGRDGVPYKDWGPHASGWIRAPAYGGPYSPKKNAHEKASGAESTVGWVPTQLNSVNIHIFRYADLLLLLAEAEVEAGSLENARTIVNEIRTRAGKTAQGPGTDRATIAVPINDPRITWATYRVGLYTAPFASQADGRDKVRAERRLELAMEGQRFFDLERWGIAAATLNAYVQVEKNRRLYLTGAEAFTSRHRYFPIPAIQIELSKANGQNTLTQNPGW